MNAGWELPYPSARQPVLAGDVAATSHPLATEAAMRAYRDGGNAVDAALAAAITLTVVEPVSNGIGSDAFAIVWDGEAFHGLNASGCSPATLDAARLRAAGTMPLLGWDAVTVPGAVSAWVALSERFGALPFPQLFSDAVRHARDGHPVAPIVAAMWSRAPAVYGGMAEFRDFAEVFLPGGRADRPGRAQSGRRAVGGGPRRAPRGVGGTAQPACARRRPHGAAAQRPGHRRPHRRRARAAARRAPGPGQRRRNPPGRRGDQAGPGRRLRPRRRRGGDAGVPGVAAGRRLPRRARRADRHGPRR